MVHDMGEDGRMSKILNLAKNIHQHHNNAIVVSAQWAGMASR